MTDPTYDHTVHAGGGLSPSPADAVRRAAPAIDPALQASGWAALAADHVLALRLSGSGGATRVALPLVGGLLSLAVTVLALIEAADGELPWWRPLLHAAMTVLLTGMGVMLVLQRRRVVQDGRPAVADPGPPPPAVVEWAHEVMDRAGLGPSPRWQAVSGALRRAEPRMRPQHAVALARRLAR